MNEIQKVSGNIKGIRQSVLEDMEKLYDMDMELLRHQFISDSLLDSLIEFTEKIGREVMVYIARDGMVMQVIAGRHENDKLPDIRIRRGKYRLTGVRCIHTHPGGDSAFSEADIRALKRMRFDAMAVVGVLGGRAAGVEVGLLEDIGPGGEYALTTLGPYRGDEIPQEELLERMRLNDERIFSASRAIAQAESSGERAVLVGMDSDESMDELERLADTAGAAVLEKVIQQKSSPDSAFFIGRGKAEELALLKQSLDANLFIFDDELTGVQLKNLEEALGCRVIDRTSLILDIFARRASSSEGKLQVELAQYKYRLPRLMGSSAELSRLGGGIGTRGPGESKLETDRRTIRRRITELERDVKELEKQRGVRRTMREKAGVATVAIVGYTNSGKSTLLNALSGSDLVAEDKLFATLDPVTRKVELPGMPALMTDTVGFIKKLPHDLVDAFRSTLEEALHADLLLHVVDASAPDASQQYRTAEAVLESLGASGKPRVVALNKVDRLQGEPVYFDTSGAPRIEISAATGQGLETLLSTMAEIIARSKKPFDFEIPYDRTDIVALAHRIGDVKSEEYLEGHIKLSVVLDEEGRARISKLLN